MKKKSSLYTLVILSFILLSGCFNIGRNFPTDPIKRLQIGKTTKSEAKKIFGTPWRTGIEDGDETITYGYYRYTLFGEAKTSDLVLRFDKKNILKSYTFNSNKYEKK